MAEKPTTVSVRTPDNRVQPRERQYPDPKAKLRQEVAKTGHSWDGIEEYDNPMPRWWLWTFYITIAWAVVYWILFPAWPMVGRATQGLLGYDSRVAVAADIQRFDAENQVWFDRLMATDPEAVRTDPDLQRFAVNAGASVFRAQCSQCHGAGAAGVQASGFPSLLDDQWIWGGTIDEIHQTVRYGIRNEDYPDARYSEMPAFGRDGLLDQGEIDQVVHHVLRLSGQAHDEALATPGEQVFLDNCAACHGDAGEGDQSMGAPALNNQIWLYGGSFEAIWHTVYHSRFGVMPGFAGRLRDAEIRAVAAYVHQLGGGQ